VVAARQYYQSASIVVDRKVEGSAEFLELVFTLKTFKNFQSLKQRMQVGLCMLNCATIALEVKECQKLSPKP